MRLLLPLEITEYLRYAGRWPYMHFRIYSSEQLHEISGSIIPMSLMRKQRHREGKQLDLDWNP